MSLRAGGVFLAGLLLVACEYRVPTRVPLGYELYDPYCNDGIDNDGDGLIDCDDPGCPFTSAWCGEALGLIPPVEEREDSVYLCRDRVDNDGNGQFDCGDDKCQDIAETCCLREFSDALCSDGIDNDGNGFADCADFGCSRGAYVTVCGRTEIVPPQSPAEACSDGFDGDGDGDVDCEDLDCVGVSFEGGSCPSQPENTIERCTNGRDEDGDGNRDCADPDCQALERICLPRGAESTVDLCFDGIDNDDNGFTDCDDFGCSRSGSPEVMERCGSGGTGEPEDDLETCFDGIDNDGNGFTDCNDFSCSRSDDPALAEACANAGENTFERCSDGEDNDGNGFVDCADFSCSQPDEDDIARDPMLATACDETGGYFAQPGVPPTAAEVRAAEERCSDGLDNDGDGFIDCDDFNCNWNPLLRDAEGNAFCEQSRSRLLCE